jgi:hypothetical protein
MYSVTLGRQHFKMFWIEMGHKLLLFINLGYVIDRMYLVRICNSKSSNLFHSKNFIFVAKLLRFLFISECLIRYCVPIKAIIKFKLSQLLIQFKCCCCFDMLEFVEGIFITSFEKIHICRSFTELIEEKKFVNLILKTCHSVHSNKEIKKP